MEIPESIAHQSIPQVERGYLPFTLGALTVIYLAASATERPGIIGGVAVIVLAGVAVLISGQHKMSPGQAEEALMKAQAEQLLKSGAVTRDDVREIERWLNENDFKRRCEKKPEWLKRGDTPQERFARILVNCALFP